MAESERHGGLSVRILVLALLVQLALGGALVVVAVNGFPMIGGASERASNPSAPVPPARTDGFDARRAFALIRRQVAVGQRPAGSPQLRRLAEDLRRELPSGRFEPVPGHRGLRNVVGTLPGRRPAIVVGAHYDTEHRPRGFVGANDGAAGTAAVIELARALRGTRGREVRFVLFDGEEEPPGCPPDRFAQCALRGSRAYVNAHRREVGHMILLDYVANRGLRLPREGSSDKRLWSRLRVAARAVGVGAVFPDEDQLALLDDHTPFLRAGIPAIDLIDFSYRHRDTVQDTVDKLSLASLDAVGETVVRLVTELRR